MWPSTNCDNNSWTHDAVNKHTAVQPAVQAVIRRLFSSQWGYEAEMAWAAGLSTCLELLALDGVRIEPVTCEVGVQNSVMRPVNRTVVHELFLITMIDVLCSYFSALDSTGNTLVTDTLQHVMNAAACVISDTRKFDHGLTQILHDDLHWLDVADRVTYKLGIIMHKCRHGKAPQYLADFCTPVSGQPQNNWWWCHNIGCPLLADEHLLCTTPRSGTPCQTTSVHSRTMSPSDRVWKLVFSAGTSVPSALETLWQCAIWIHIYHYHMVRHLYETCVF